MAQADPTSDLLLRYPPTPPAQASGVPPPPESLDPGTATASIPISRNATTTAPTLAAPGPVFDVLLKQQTRDHKKALQRQKNSGLSRTLLSGTRQGTGSSETDELPRQLDVAEEAAFPRERPIRPTGRVMRKVVLDDDHAMLQGPRKLVLRDNSDSSGELQGNSSSARARSEDQLAFRCVLMDIFEAAQRGAADHVSIKELLEQRQSDRGTIDSHSKTADGPSVHRDRVLRWILALQRRASTQSSSGDENVRTRADFEERMSWAGLLALLRANEPHYTANSYQGFKASPYKSSGRLQRKRRSPPPPPGVFRQFPKENLTIEIFVEPDEHDFLGNITSKTDAMQVAKGFIFKHGIDIVHADSVRYQIQREQFPLCHRELAMRTNEHRLLSHRYSRARDIIAKNRKLGEELREASAAQTFASGFSNAADLPQISTTVRHFAQQITEVLEDLLESETLRQQHEAQAHDLAGSCPQQWGTETDFLPVLEPSSVLGLGEMPATRPNHDDETAPTELDADNGYITQVEFDMYVRERRQELQREIANDRRGLEEENERLKRAVRSAGLETAHLDDQLQKDRTDLAELTRSLKHEKHQYGKLQEEISLLQRRRSILESKNIAKDDPKRRVDSPEHVIGTAEEVTDAERAVENKEDLIQSFQKDQTNFAREKEKLLATLRSLQLEQVQRRTKPIIPRARQRREGAATSDEAHRTGTGGGF